MLDAGTTEAFEGPRPTVLTEDGKVSRLNVTELTEAVEQVTRVRLPKQLNTRVPRERRDVVARMRAALAEAEDVPSRPRGKGRASAADDAELEGLRRDLRQHPCHACPDREAHARWAERWTRLDKEHRALLRRIEGRTGTIAREFDRVCDVLVDLGYLRVRPARDTDDVDHDDAEARLRTTVTGHGKALKRLYAENDLLLAQCLRSGVWSGLDAAGLAAVVSTVVYEARRDDGGEEPHLPGGPEGRLGRAVEGTVREWSRLEDVEVAHRVEPTPVVDTTLVAPVYRWAQGRSLESVLRGTELAAGDFVRWCKQVIDVLDQISVAAPDQETALAAHEAVGLLRRGVVAYTSV